RAGIVAGIAEAERDGRPSQGPVRKGVAADKLSRGLMTMSADQRIRRRMLWLSFTLVGLLLLDSCADTMYGWHGTALSCGCAGPKLDCTYQSASDVPSPDGQRHAISEARSCSVKGEHQWTSVYV